MAELKRAEKFQYDMPVLDEPITEVQPEIKPKKVHKDNNLPQSPKRRLKNISRLEKAIGFLLIVAIIGIAILTIQVRTSIVQVTNSITETQATIAEKEEASLKLEQQKSELSKADRVKATAKNKGLSINEGSLRKVK